MVVGESSNLGPTDYTSKATLWQDGQVYDLNDLLMPGTGWSLGQAVGVNDTGQIIGSGFAAHRAIAAFPAPAYRGAIWS
jgi:hypothetical protein